MKEGPLGKLLSKIPYLRYAYLYRRYSLHRPGHYYSPVINLDEISTRRHQIWREGKDLPGINLNDAAQEAFMVAMEKAAAVIPFKARPGEANHRYYYENRTYEHADGLTLFTVLMHFRPRRVIEVGSGFSSSLMLDTNDTLLDHSIHFTFIEPNPDMTLNKLLRKEDYQNTDVKVDLVQQVDPAIFSTLQENDVLLIDNSHVSKTGSDVNYLMTEVLPRLNKGVLIHIHDIFYPFEYPQEWVFEHRLGWNEIYTVHNFLLFNNAFEIVFFSDYMQQKTRATHAGKIPLFFKGRTGNIWLRKVV